MEPNARIHVAGHRGLVGSAIARRLRAAGYENLLFRTHAELDLESREAVSSFYAAERPEYVFLAAAKVGGIHANSTCPVDFLLRNLRIQENVIEAAHRHGVKGLAFLGSSCIYPREAPQPLREEYLLTGPLEPTNEAYAVAKIAGIELCEAHNRQYGTRFFSIMPTNLYGPGDSYDLEHSHVLPALIRKCHLARLAQAGRWEAVARDERAFGPIPDDVMAGLREPGGPLVRLWGTGAPRREFLFSEDAADACIFLMERLDTVFSPGSAHPGGRRLFNIGCGADSTIREIAREVAAVAGFSGPLSWDASRPDGTPQKLLDVSRLRGLGWAPRVSLPEGLRLAFEDYLSRSAAACYASAGRTIP